MPKFVMNESESFYRLCKTLFSASVSIASIKTSMGCLMENRKKNRKAGLRCNAKMNPIPRDSLTTDQFKTKKILFPFEGVCS